MTKRRNDSQAGLWGVFERLSTLQVRVSPVSLWLTVMCLTKRVTSSSKYWLFLTFWRLKPSFKMWVKLKKRHKTPIKSLYLTMPIWLFQTPETIFYMYVWSFAVCTADAEKNQQLLWVWGQAMSCHWQSWGQWKGWDTTCRPCRAQKTLIWGVTLLHFDVSFNHRKLLVELFARNVT